MFFSFLNPWLWLGALAVAAPIWLHLRRRRQTGVQRFSAVRFLEDQPEPRRSPLRLRDRLLFALRLLALLLIVSAFARPVLRGTRTVAVQESRVFILDNTLSRQAGEGFRRDQTRLAREVATAPPGSQLAVIELRSEPRLLVGFGEDPQAARQKIEALRPSFERGSYLAAFRQANLLLANSLGQKKRIVLLGDGQENQWNENVNTPPFLRNVEIDVPRPAEASLPNAWLSEPRIERVFAGDKALVHFTVKLNHKGPARTANLIVRADGQDVIHRAVPLENQPETILLQAQWAASPGTWLEGEALLQAEPDALAADNRVWFSLAPVLEGKVAVLAQSRYLRLALSPEVMRGQWAARFLDPQHLGEKSVSLRLADVLCLESSYLQSAEARKLLSRYLAAGRGVFLMVDRVTPVIDGFLHELGFQTEASPPGADQPEKFQYVSSNHPIFHPFLSPDYGNLLEVEVSRYVRLRAAQATPLIFGEHGGALFFEVTRSPGRLFVAAFGLDREHTSWPIHPSFVPFLDLTLNAARVEDSTPNSFEPGELARIQLPPSTAAHLVVLQGREGEVGRAAVEEGRAQLVMPDQPGLYRLSIDGNSRPEKIFAVNPSPKESELSFIGSPPALKLWEFPPSVQSRPEAMPAPTPVTHVLHQRLWWWMVLGGLLALLLEMALADARKESA